MNYSNMIEEKNLKKTFIIATLCSTLIGTFSSSIGLWDRVQERHDRHKQKKKDGSQDAELKKLKERLDESEKRSSQRAIQPPPPQQPHPDMYRNGLQDAGMMIQRQYDEGYGRLGNRFAQGDLMTENQLQKQIIALQQSVITVLQDALYNDRQLTRGDMDKIVAASNEARENSLLALRDQQKRLTRSDSPQNAPSVASAHASNHDSDHGSTHETNRELTTTQSRRASTVVDSDPLFCHYSLDLQREGNMPLHGTFAPRGECRCPDCGVSLGIRSDDYWQIGKRVASKVSDGNGYKEVIKTREFTLGQRFVVKCHTADGEFACILCNRHRDRDAVCRTVDALVNHVGRFHDITEFESEVDLRESIASS